MRDPWPGGEEAPAGARRILDWAITAVGTVYLGFLVLVAIGGVVVVVIVLPTGTVVGFATALYERPWTVLGTVIIVAGAALAILALVVAAALLSGPVERLNARLGIVTRENRMDWTWFLAWLVASAVVWSYLGIGAVVAASLFALFAFYVGRDYDREKRRAGADEDLARWEHWVADQRSRPLELDPYEFKRWLRLQRLPWSGGANSVAVAGFASCPAEHPVLRFLKDSDRGRSGRYPGARLVHATAPDGSAEYRVLFLWIFPQDHSYYVLSRDHPWKRERELRGALYPWEMVERPLPEWAIEFALIIDARANGQQHDLVTADEALGILDELLCARLETAVQGGSPRRGGGRSGTGRRAG